MDVNAPDFIESFKKEDAVVGIVGQGFVGTAMRAYFERHEFKVISYDKYQPASLGLEEVVKNSHIIFVCVPTPMRQTGECYTGIPQEVFSDIARVAQEIGRPTDSFVICLKSTVPPGFTDSMREKYPNMRITFSPEFLMEKTASQDMINANRILCGGSPEDTAVVLQFFLVADKRRVDEGKVILVQCPAKSAEMAKLMTNGLLFTKVVFCNEIHELCKKMEIDYAEVRWLTVLDQRIGASHTQVPGPDGFLGAGGHCFPKDMHNLKFVAENVGMPEKLFSAVLSRNNEVREEADWEKMNDRAVTAK
jgi:UDPglucose 6-dehydrogenase